VLTWHHAWMKIEAGSTRRLEDASVAITGSARAIAT
jgi:hypothetical protein